MTNTRYQAIAIVSDSWLVAGFPWWADSTAKDTVNSLRLFEVGKEGCNYTQNKVTTQVTFELDMDRETERGTQFRALLSGESALYNQNSPEFESLKQDDTITALFYKETAAAAATTAATPTPTAYSITMPISKLLDTHRDKKGYKIRRNKFKDYAILTQGHCTNNYPCVDFSVSGSRLVWPQGAQGERNPCVDIYQFIPECKPAPSGSDKNFSTGTVLARTKITIQLMGLENFNRRNSDLTIVGNDLLVLTVCGSLRLFQGA